MKSRIAAFRRSYTQELLSTKKTNTKWGCGKQGWMQQIYCGDLTIGHINLEDCEWCARINWLTNKSRRQTMPLCGLFKMWGIILSSLQRRASSMVYKTFDIHFYRLGVCLLFRFIGQKLMRPWWAGGWEDEVSFCQIPLAVTRMQICNWNIKDTGAREWATIKTAV